MIYIGDGKLKPEEGEPAFRSCWNCNSGHEHLKKVNTLHYCFSCGRYWIFDHFVDSFKDDAAFDAFFSKELGLKPGQSTTTIDAGYRVVLFKIGATPESDEVLKEVNDGEGESASQD